MRRLRGRALAAAAAQSAGLRRDLAQLQDRIRATSMNERRAASAAADNLIKWLAEEESFKEQVARSYIRESANRLGQMLGQEFARQFAKNRPIFEQAQKASDAYLNLALTGLDIRGRIDTLPTEGMVLRADFTIPPLHRAFHIMR